MTDISDSNKLSESMAEKTAKLHRLLSQPDKQRLEHSMPFLCQLIDLLFYWFCLIYVSPNTPKIRYKNYALFFKVPCEKCFHCFFVLFSKI